MSSEKRLFIKIFEVCEVQNYYKYTLGLCLEKLETISVFQQTQINITFFANHSTVLVTLQQQLFLLFVTGQ